MGDCQNLILFKSLLVCGTQLVINACKLLSHGNLSAADSHVMNLGAKGSSGTNWKDSVRGGILSVINVNVV